MFLHRSLSLFLIHITSHFWFVFSKDVQLNTTVRLFNHGTIMVLRIPYMENLR